MRTRAEIEQDMTARLDAVGAMAVTSGEAERLMLEVLLDIRELLLSPISSKGEV